MLSYFGPQSETPQRGNLVGLGQGAQGGRRGDKRTPKEERQKGGNKKEVEGTPTGVPALPSPLQTPAKLAQGLLQPVAHSKEHALADAEESEVEVIVVHLKEGLLWARIDHALLWLSGALLPFVVIATGCHALAPLRVRSK
jgi:hypothetical protein